MENERNPKRDLIRRFDQRYKEEEHAWGVEPSAGIAAALPLLVPGRVLDLGAGDGRNTLFLAHSGFDVTAVDVAPQAVENLRRYAARAGLEDRVEAVVADIAGYRIDGEFDNVITTYTLHFLSRDDFFPVLERMMSATRDGGVNVIEDFTQEGPMYSPDTSYYWLASGELRGIYEERGWKVLHYEERVVTARATDEHGNQIQQGAVTIVAAKPHAKHD